MASRPSVPSPRLAMRPVRFPRIGLRADGGVRRFCQLVFLRHPLAAWRIVFLFVSSLVSLLRLVGASRDYSLRFACQSVSSRRFAGVSLFRLARRSVSCSSVLLVVSRCLVLPGLSSPLVSPGVSLSSPCSLVLLGGSSRRLVERVGFSLFVLSVLVSSRSLPFHGHDCGGSSFAVSYRCGMFPLPLPRRRIRLGDGGWRKWACRSTIRRDAPFYSARFPIRAGNEMTMMI